MTAKTLDRSSTLPPETQNLEIHPNLKKTSTQDIETQHSTPKTLDQSRQNSSQTYSEIINKNQHSRCQAPQTSQPKPLTSHHKPQPPRHHNPPHHLPLRVKLPPPQPLSSIAPSHPTVPMNSSSQLPLKTDTTPHTPAPRISRSPISTPSQTNYPLQAPDTYPLYQNPMDITSILTSFLKDLQETIKPLINLLKRILSEIPFNFPR
ncbi:protein ALEX-like [Halyomorpha halys]|uniref:protein ALEX-like n=1 Tax=Halyomorpha halys TaxID=286706 RepID=UPI0034D19687